MIITTSAAGPHVHHGITFPDFRPALRKAVDYAVALHYRYVRMRIEGELRGPAGRLVRRDDLGF